MAAVAKRPGDDQSSGALIVQKRAKTGDAPQTTALIEAVQSAPTRTSSLLAPIMLLSGHDAEVLSLRFSPDGETLATSSADKNIFLWNVYGECQNTTVMRGHTGAVLEIAYSSDGTQLYSASADRTGAIWDVHGGRRVKRLKDHTGIVNAVCPARRSVAIIVTGSDDGSAKIWDMRTRGTTSTIDYGTPVTAVAVADDSNIVYVGGVSNFIAAYDLRKDTEQVYSLLGHTDTVTSTRVSPDGSYLLTNAMDSTVRLWDIRPYAPVDRCIKVFQGAQHNFEKNLIRANWSANGLRIAAGSAADRCVFVWDVVSKQVIYRLPGHAGCPNEVDFHPTEPIIGSCGSDKKVYLGEI